MKAILLYLALRFWGMPDLRWTRWGPAVEVPEPVKGGKDWSKTVLCWPEPNAPLWLQARYLLQLAGYAQAERHREVWYEHKA